MGEYFRIISEIQDFETDFRKKVSLKMLNYADYKSFSDYISDNKNNWLFNLEFV